MPLVLRKVNPPTSSMCVDGDCIGYGDRAGCSVNPTLVALCESNMSNTFFGTDGIRSSANAFPMTSELALKVGRAAGTLFTNDSYRPRVVIGKDTRLSGYMIETALVSGFTAVGTDVFLLGPTPTPAVAMLTRSLRASLTQNRFCSRRQKRG